MTAWGVVRWLMPAKLPVGWRRCRGLRKATYTDDGRRETLRVWTWPAWGCGKRYERAVDVVFPDEAQPHHRFPVDGRWHQFDTVLDERGAFRGRLVDGALWG